MFEIDKKLDYAITTFRFLIVGEGKISGVEFSDKIRNIFDCVNNLHNKECAEVICDKVEELSYDGFCLYVKYKRHYETMHY